MLRTQKSLRGVRLKWVLGLLGCLVWPALAQAEDYRVGPDDVLSIVVQRHPELSVPDIAVPSSGKLDLPEAGQIYVTGKTTTQVARAIASVLGRAMVAPQVTVLLKQQRARRVYVLGAVAKPGVYEMKTHWRVTEALAAAGGLPGRPEETTVTLARPGLAPLDIDLQAIVADPSNKENRRLQPNDVLALTAQDPKRITVSGDVLKPDVYELRRAPRLIDALTAAGGLRQRAQNSRGFLVRQGEKIALDLTAAVEFKDPTANLALQPGDLVMLEGVPPLKVSVDGFVRNPGNFDMATDAGVIQAVAQAGGLTVPADQVVAGVRRGAQFLPVDLTRAAFDPTVDIPLQSGDVVLLSEPKIIRVQVTGQVKEPRALRLPLETTVLDAVARAGGLSIQPEVARISVLRSAAGGKQVPLQIDPVALFTLRDLRQNPRLHDGDLVSVTAIKAQVATISGEVARPGAYEIQEGDGVPELIARAGGAGAAASLTRVVLQRGGTTQTVDVYDALKTGQKSPVTLQEGDFIVVPRNEAHVVVMQAVQRPGSYLIPEKETLTIADALGLAGGPRDRAAVKQVALLRPNPAAPQGVERRIISLEAIYKGDLSQNVPLQSGDVIYVPEAKIKGSPFGVLGQVIGTLTGLRYLSGR